MYSQELPSELSCSQEWLVTVVGHSLLATLSLLVEDLSMETLHSPAHIAKFYSIYTQQWQS